MGLPLAQEYFYETGRLFYDRAEYSKALEKLEKAAEIFFANKQFDRYTDTLNYILRILVEREDHQKIQEEKEKLQDLVIKENLQLNARTYYVLGLCSYYRGGMEKAAGDYFNQSLKIALESDNKLDMCYAIYGLANTYYAQGLFEEALKELYNLEVFFGALQVPELQISSRLLNGLVFRNRGEYDRALECFWQAYEMLKTNTSMMLYINALYGIGSCYQRSGQLELARLYLELALRSLNEEELPRMARWIKKSLSDLGVDTGHREYDIVFDPNSNSVVEKNLGRISFKNQFILIDLLNLFVRNPGKIFPKEVLVKKVWNQDYDPSVHDNKIYVTIKRLRQLIEPDMNKPKYIFRAKNGYYLNKATRVLVEH